MGGRTVVRFKTGGTGGPETAYLHADHLGSPVAATDDTGAILWAEHFTPYGENIPGPAANPDDEGFTGHIQDTDTGLTYMQARYYDPVIGRFLSNDPVGFAEGRTAYFSRYAYTANDPVNAIDPDGRQAMLPDEAFAQMSKIANGATPEEALTESRVQNASSTGAALLMTEVALIAADVALGGPTGEGIAPAAGIRSVREGLEGAAQSALPKAGSSAGPGAGKGFSEAVKDAARAESPNCVFCGQQTVRSPTSRPDRSNIDHAIPKSRGGNNTIDNAQNTCQSCNLDKATDTTEEYLQRRGGE